MKALAMMLKPIPYGWAVQLTDGRELARFLGPWSKSRALRYVARATGRRNPPRPRPGSPAFSGACR
jgi:hypothetical protein